MSRLSICFAFVVDIFCDSFLSSFFFVLPIETKRKLRWATSSHLQRTEDEDEDGESRREGGARRPIRRRRKGVDGEEGGEEEGGEDEGRKSRRKQSRKRMQRAKRMALSVDQPDEEREDVKGEKGPRNEKARKKLRGAMRAAGLAAKELKATRKKRTKQAPSKEEVAEKQETAGMAVLMFRLQGLQRPPLLPEPEPGIYI